MTVQSPDPRLSSCKPPTAGSAADIGTVDAPCLERLICCPIIYNCLKDLKSSLNQMCSNQENEGIYSLLSW